jgi:anti-sigma regulatory factor (Ser/Thr protein kinase)
VDREDFFGIGEPSGFPHHVWPAQPEYLGSVRAAVRGWLSGLDLSADVQRDLVLATNEAASNAIEHAYSPEPLPASMVDLTLWTELNALGIEIVDYGSWLAPPSIAPGRSRAWHPAHAATRPVRRHQRRQRRDHGLLQHPLPINGHVAAGL